MALDVRKSYHSLILLQNYPKLDYEGYDTNRIKGQVVDSKEHPTQVQSVLLLSNGDIAISGGPKRFEVMIYRNNFQTERARKETLIQVDSLDTGKVPVVQLLEAQNKFLIVAQEHSCFMVFYRDDEDRSFRRDQRPKSQLREFLSGQYAQNKNKRS